MKQCGIALQCWVTGGGVCIPKTEELLCEFMFKVKSVFPAVFLERVLDGANLWSAYVQAQQGQRIAVVGLFAIAGQSSEFSGVSDSFHPFNAPKE